MPNRPTRSVCPIRLRKRLERECTARRGTASRGGGFPALALAARCAAGPVGLPASTGAHVWLAVRSATVGALPDNVAANSIYPVLFSKKGDI